MGKKSVPKYYDEKKTFSPGDISNRIGRTKNKG